MQSRQRLRLCVNFVCIPIVKTVLCVCVCVCVIHDKERGIQQQQERQQHTIVVVDFGDKEKNTQRKGMRKKVSKRVSRHFLTTGKKGLSRIV